MIKRLCLIAILLLISPLHLHSATINVPGDHPTIQGAINIAESGDQVVVYPGSYVGPSNFLGKQLILRSSSGPELTTILVTSSIVINTSEPTGTTIKGFTLSCTTVQAIEVSGGANLEIRECIVKNYSGGGVVIDVHSPAFLAVSDCRFYDNGGLSCIGFYSGEGSIVNNTFDSNARGFFNIGSPTVEAVNNIVTNSTQYGIYGTFSRLDYNDVWSNSPDYQGGATPGSNSLNVDPLFVDPLNGDYELQTGSMCIDAGDPSTQYNDPDGTIADIGAFHYEPAVTYTIPVDFSTLDSALQIARTGDTIEILPGTYSGHGNRDLAIPDIGVVIRGSDSNDRPIFDCQGTVSSPHFAIRIDSGQSEELQVRDLVFANAYSTGGCVQITNASPLIYGCRITNTQVGSGVTINGTSAPIVRLCTLDSNMSTGLITNSIFNTTVDSCDIHTNGFGVEASGTLTLSDSRVYGNIQEGIRIQSYQPSIRSLITDCLVEDNGAGGLWVDGSIDIKNCTLRNNCTTEPTNYGSITALPDVGDSVSIERCFLVENDCQSGGLSTWNNGGPTTITESVIANNRGEVAAVTLGNTFPAVFNNCTIAFNSGISAVYSEFDLDVFQRCIIAFNDAPAFYVGDRIEISCTNIFGNAGGDWDGIIQDSLGVNGNLSIDPLFCDTSVRLYTIDTLSAMLPFNNSCGELIGALAQGCVSVCCFEPGDSNDDGGVNIADVVFIISYIFALGPVPPCLDQADTNGSNEITIGDVTSLIAWIFATGPPPICGTTGNAYD